MDCRRRNLTEERVKGVRMGKPWPVFENMKKYMFDTGLPYQLESFTQDKERTCYKEMSDGRDTILVRRERTQNIWHRLVELWAVPSSLDALKLSGYLVPSAMKDVKVGFQDDTPGPWDDLLWPVVTGTRPLYMSQLKDTSLGTIILPLTGHSNQLWLNA